ncbi:non-specific lipid transfer protein GPI-anchored 31-like [Wolffia australiana]
MALLLAFAALIISLSGVASAPAPTSDHCFSYSIRKLAPCTDYLHQGSEKPPADGPCCSGLKDLFNLEPLCVCFLIEPNSKISTIIDVNRAFELPAPCNASVPPLNNCLSSSSPISAPQAQIAAAAPGVATGQFFLAAVFMIIVSAFF